MTHFMKFKLYYIQKIRMGIYKILIIKTVIHLIVIGATYRKIFKIKISRKLWFQRKKYF